MIFAAGLGTRLRPLTDHTPKALVSVAGKPMLERVILRLKEAGFNDITVNIHHFGEQIIKFLRANNDFGITIHLSDERDMLLDTGGGIKKARPFLDDNEPFLVHNADILSDINLAELYRHHRESNAEATLLVSQRQTSRYLLLDDANRLHGWINKSTGETKPEGFSFQERQYKGNGFRWHSRHIPFPFPLYGKQTMGREVLHYSFLSIRVRNSLHTGLSASGPPLVRHRQAGNTCKSRGILPIERQNEEKRK